MKPEEEYIELAKIALPVLFGIALFLYAIAKIITYRNRR